jgi:hypothetical protein
MFYAPKRNSDALKANRGLEFKMRILGPVL